MTTTRERAPRPAIARGPLLWLGLCALVLTLGSGEPPGAAAARDPSALEPVSLGAAAAPGARAIAEVMGRANPSLSLHERERIGRAVVRYAGKYGLDPELVAAVILVESRARPGARSPKGAIGLMQVMPHMYAVLGLVGNISTIETNIEAGCAILAGNIRRLGEADGISAYFWGSRIRGGAYLERVRAARQTVREWLRS